MKKIITILIFLILFLKTFSQDSLNTKRLLIFTSINAGFFAGGVITINELWYKDFPKTKFHWFNDNNEWLQVDKIGHGFTSYYLSKVLRNGFFWVGYNDKKSAVFGSILGFVYISTIEIFDGYSQNWGASYGDLIANFTGTSFYLSQQLIWNEQKIIPKFSFHTTKFAQYRTELLGKSTAEQILKDYNGQTYWLSFNIKSLANLSKFPAWLNFAVGYGATAMTGGKNNPENTIPDNERYRQYYISLDIDLQRIKTKSRFLGTVFSFVNVIKIPLPTIEFTNGKTKFYGLYF